MPPQHEVPEKRNNKFDILTQEHLLGAALGSILTGVIIFQQWKSIYESISQTQSQPHEPIFGRRSRQELAHIWNKAVDKTLGPIQGRESSSFFSAKLSIFPQAASKDGELIMS
ncbi:Uncharacterized protein Fot_27807 [Forsythia ovata]|uniref:ATP synthase protein MI25 n=1 Tax=Forsythia ovata TaxID=205694 RepID=A0ABD1TM78_9LAMI